MPLQPISPEIVMEPNISLTEQISEIENILNPIFSKREALDELNKASSEFWHSKLTKAQKEDDETLEAIGYLRFGNLEEINHYRQLRPDLAILLDEYNATGIINQIEDIQANIKELREQIVPIIEPKYEALKARIIKSFNYDEFVRRCAETKDGNYSIGVLTGYILFQMDNLDSDFISDNTAEKCEFLEYRFQTAQKLYQSLLSEYPDLVLDKPQLNPDDEQINQSQNYLEVAKTMDENDPDSEYARYSKLYEIFKYDPDYCPPSDDRPNTIVFYANRLSDSDKERLKKYPIARVALHKALVAEHRRLEEYGVVSKGIENSPSPDILYINKEPPVIISGLETQIDGHILMIGPSDVPNILESLYIDPNSEEGQHLTFERVAKMIPDHFIAGIEEIVFLDPEANNVEGEREGTVASTVGEIQEGFSQVDIETEKYFYIRKVRETITHEVFEHAKYKLSLDELQAFMQAVDTDNVNRNSPLNITMYIRFVRSNIDIYGTSRLAREDLCETAKLFVSDPASLNHVSPARYQFMLNLFVKYMPDNWKEPYREAHKRQIERSRGWQQALKVDDDQLTNQILEHEQTPVGEILIPRDETGKITSPNKTMSVTGEYIITDGKKDIPNGKIIIHRPPYLKVVKPFAA